MATRLKKGESPFKKVEEIEKKIKNWRSRLNRAAGMLIRLEKQRTYYAKKAVEQGV